MIVFSLFEVVCQDVRNIIVDICKNNGGMADAEAETFVKKLESQKRYSADVWS